MIYWLGTTNDG